MTAPVFTSYIVELEQPAPATPIYLASDDTWTPYPEKAEVHYSLGRARWKAMVNKASWVVADIGTDEERRLTIEHDEPEVTR